MRCRIRPISRFPSRALVSQICCYRSTPGTGRDSREETDEGPDVSCGIPPYRGRRRDRGTPVVGVVGPGFNVIDRIRIRNAAHVGSGSESNARLAESEPAE